MTDRNMHTTTYAYDVQNRLVLTTDPLGNMFQRSYDCAGNLLSQTDARRTHQFVSLRSAESRDSEDRRPE